MKYLKYLGYFMLFAIPAMLADSLLEKYTSFEGGSIIFIAGMYFADFRSGKSWGIRRSNDKEWEKLTKEAQEIAQESNEQAKQFRDSTLALNLSIRKYLKDTQTLIFYIVNSCFMREKPRYRIKWEYDKDGSIIGHWMLCGNWSAGLLKPSFYLPYEKEDKHNP